MNIPLDPSAASTGRGNPYAETPLPVAARSPGGLTVVCVLAIFLGILFLLFGALTILQLTFARQIQQAAGSMAPQSAKVLEAQEQMNTELLGMMSSYTPFYIILSIVQMGLAFGLLYGGIRGMKLSAQARQVLLWTCAIGIGYEAIQFGLFLIMQLQMAPIMEQHMEKVMRASGSSPGAEFGSSMYRISLIVGIGFQLIWSLIKVGYFAFATNYLKRPPIRDLFLTEAK
jgi:hypothetical protein